jgi:hypothetical protein
VSKCLRPERLLFTEEASNQVISGFLHLHLDPLSRPEEGIECFLSHIENFAMTKCFARHLCALHLV